MRTFSKLVPISAIAALLVAGGPATGAARDLTGLWAAKHATNTVDVRGPLLIQRVAGGWRAQISGQSAPVAFEGTSVSFALPGGKGRFDGRLLSDTTISGFWTQPRTVDAGTPYASPVTLIKDGPDVWKGTVTPLDDGMTFYLRIASPVNTADSSTSKATLFNPQRDLGWQWDVDRIVRHGDSARLLASAAGRNKGQDEADGAYHSDDDVLSFYFSGRGGTYDFTRVAANAPSDFYPRGRPNAPYLYAPPPDEHDGWRVGNVSDVGISQTRIDAFVRRLIDTPMDSVHSPQIHALLIARHGKLVVEEYFHGWNRDMPHDPRSASKSVTSTLFGAAILAGLPVSPSTPVYSAMNGGAFPAGLDPLKRSMTVESLLTMSSGLDCDDNDPASPGNEETMLENATDYYRFALGLKTIRPPGQEAVYCSIQPNLVGGVLARTTHRSLQDLFQDLVAQPMQISHYYMSLQPTGEPYMGGGLRFIPRDFMKFGQLLMDGGVWNGHRILSKEWSEKSTSAITYLSQYKSKYGYLWWVEDLRYKGGTVRAFSMLGNGGQDVVAIPQLDLIIETFAGNYGDRVSHIILSHYIPDDILPAVTR
jgi:CubicO group peptidase (beta-lactamase class C family)